MAPQLSPPPTPTTPVAVAHAAILYSTKREPFENYGKRFLFHLEKLCLFYLLFFSCRQQIENKLQSLWHHNVSA